MSTPKVSVIMPVYNTAAYLGEGIESILTQSFTDFELLIINDGSTDGSGAIARQYTDPRIVYLENDRNKGLVYTLNRGLEQARGDWIARMDGDDVCMPQRFERQLSYLSQHPEVDVLASRIELMDEWGRGIGPWKEDAAHVSPENIRSFLPVNNCIAHPSVMAKTSVMKTFRYREEQAESEDYDLWLRMAASGVQIHKLDEILLRHRIRSTSFTRERQQNVFSKLARVKLRFVDWAISAGLSGPFVTQVRRQAYLDRGRAVLKNIKTSVWGTGS